MNVKEANRAAKKLVQEVWSNSEKFKMNCSEVIKMLQSALVDEPNNISTLTNLGAALCDIGSHQEASDYLLKAIELGSKDKNTFYNLGVSYVNSGAHEEGRKFFKLASNLEKSDETWDAYFDPMAH